MKPCFFKIFDIFHVHYLGDLKAFSCGNLKYFLKLIFNIYVKNAAHRKTSASESRNIPRPFFIPFYYFGWKRDPLHSLPPPSPLFLYHYNVSSLKCCWLFPPIFPSPPFLPAPALRKGIVKGRERERERERTRRGEGGRVV